MPYIAVPNNTSQMRDRNGCVGGDVEKKERKTKSEVVG